MRTKLVVRNGKVVEIKEQDLIKESKKQVFSIGGRSGLKWSTESNNRTWIENGRVVRDKKGKRINK